MGTGGSGKNQRHSKKVNLSSFLVISDKGVPKSSTCPQSTAARACILCASQTPITIHILKAYDESYSKIIRGHKYKDKDNDKDNDKDKDTYKVPENPTYAIFLKS